MNRIDSNTTQDAGATGSAFPVLPVTVLSKPRNVVLPAPEVVSGPTINLAVAPCKPSEPGNSTDNPGPPLVPDTLADCHDVGDLWPYYKATADPYARERLILPYAPLVKFVAGRIGSGLPSNIDQGDLIADGMFGLFDAIEKFDPSRANKFETYAIQRVKGAIYDRLRTLDWVPRSVRTKMKAVDRAHQALEASLQRTPTDLEVADEAGLTMRELRGVYKQSSRTAVLSLDEHIGHTGNTSTLGDMLIRDERGGPSERIEDAELKHELRKTVLQLHEKDRIVITLYYFEGLTLSEIGRVLGVTESRACQLHGRAIASLRGHMSAHI